MESVTFVFLYHIFHRYPALAQALERSDLIRLCSPANIRALRHEERRLDFIRVQRRRGRVE